LKIILGVSASVAIYKAAELVRSLMREGADVTVVMTERAVKLVDPRLFDAVSGRHAVTDLFDRRHAFAHLEAADLAEAFAVAPATANVIGKLAAGIADDALTTVALAVESGRLVAPAMNPRMWNNAVVQRNAGTLRELGYFITPPGEGFTACGDAGTGRLAEVGTIAEDILRLAGKDERFAGKRVVVTAGPTREPFDAVRVLTNPSSGLMGYEIARRAARRGADVTLVTGAPGAPTPLATDVLVRRVRTAAEMFEATAEAFEKAEALVMAAAVSDYHFADTQEAKVKKSNGKTTVTLVPTVDILSELAEKKGGKLVIGFAAESDNIIENAGAKLLNKKLDMVVGNVVGREDVGFAVDMVEAALITAEGATSLGRVSKAALASRILDWLGERWGKA
jgi:phosphopantothenoylcysteine decarboxylase/phosphopantothenate--cysteine ligase